VTDRDRDRKKTAYETSSDHLAERLFAEDPVGALSGSQIVSAEGHSADDWSASPNRKKSKMVYELASEQPERFLELVSYLPHIIQDIFYQYFLLGRTQEQIGVTLGLRQKQVWQALELGVDGIASVSATGALPPTVLEYRTSVDQRRTLELTEPGVLGEFIVSISDEDVEKLFSPQTPDGPAC
jgi:hypothetical protein